jgi:hypothetical protein
MITVKDEKEIPKDCKELVRLFNDECDVFLCMSYATEEEKLLYFSQPDKIEELILPKTGLQSKIESVELENVDLKLRVQRLEDQLKLLLEAKQ